MSPTAILPSLAHPLALYAASAVGGFSYGAINGITPPIYSEIFGLRSFGAICQWFGRRCTARRIRARVEIMGLIIIRTG